MHSATLRTVWGAGEKCTYTFHNCTWQVSQPHSSSQSAANPEASTPCSTWGQRLSLLQQMSGICWFDPRSSSASLCHVLSPNPSGFSKTSIFLKTQLSFSPPTLTAKTGSTGCGISLFAPLHSTHTS